MLSGRRVIRLGDPTTHGGQVVSASATRIIDGKPVARKGDHVTCPLPGHGVVTIIEGDPLWTDDGRPIALEGHKCSCGCSLISTLGSLIRAHEGSGVASLGVGGDAGAILWQPYAEHDVEEHEIMYEIVEAETENPIEGMTYKLTSGSEILLDGQQLEGGKTKAYSVYEHPTLNFIVWISGTLNE